MKVPTAFEDVTKFQSAPSSASIFPGLRSLGRGKGEDRLALALSLASVPISIAVAEMLLAVALILRASKIIQGRTRWSAPRVFRMWLVWAGLEVLVWLFSPHRRAGLPEMRHLLLLAALFATLPALGEATDRLRVWRGIFLSATLCSLFVVGDFVSRLFYYHRELRAGGDVSLYLRTGGLLNNWMVYGTVEILVFAGFLSFWLTFPEERRRWWPVAVINSVAVVLSLTRMAWIACFLLLILALIAKRSKWLWLAPLLPVLLYVVVPGVVRSRIKEGLRPDYYSNLERIEMIRVGWKMIKEHPLTGVGPGRPGLIYLSYLSPGDPVPAYHGHLHNNLIQLTAEFGLPVAVVAVVFVTLLFRELWRAGRAAPDWASRFCCQAGMFGLIGFCLAGLFDYTYGHSLGLILLSFAVLSPLVPSSETSGMT